MIEFESSVRIAAVSWMLLIATTLWTAQRQTPTSWLAALCLVGAIADQGLALWESELGVWAVAVRTVSLSTVVWFWLLAKALFDDKFTWRWHYLLVLLALELGALAGWFYADQVGPRAALIPQQSIILVLILLTVYEVIHTWPVDLVERRRQARRWFLIVVAAILVWVSFYEFLRLGQARSEVIDAVGIGLFALGVLALATRMLAIRPGLLAIPAGELAPARDRADEPLVEEIRRLMEGAHLFTRHGLSIAQLAEEAHEREYRIRQAINGSLGFRNFNQFLNHYRVAEAARRLCSEEHRRQPILTIAIDVGYSSLAPFNRAFKEIQGITPTQFRRAHS